MELSRDYVYPIRLFPSKDIYWDQSREYTLPYMWRWATSSEFREIMGLTDIGKINSYNIPLHQRFWLEMKREAFIFADTKNTGESLVLSQTTPTAEITPALVRSSQMLQEGRNLAGLVAINTQYEYKYYNDTSAIGKIFTFVYVYLIPVTAFILILKDLSG
jgi:hypothetical protein